MQRHFFIIGAGLGSEELLTSEARTAILNADAVLTTQRIAQSLRGLRADIETCRTAELAPRAIASDAATVAVLVSGDVGFFSAASGLLEALQAQGETSLLCGMSSLQYFCARLHTRYDDAVLRSLHGRQGSLLGAVSYNKKVFALTGGAHRAHDICRTLTAAGLGGVYVALGENLGMAKERIQIGTAASLADEPCLDLAVLLIEHDGAIDPHRPVSDAMLTRGNVPMTKEEVRWVSVAKLAVLPHETVWDIGAGTGSVSVELARKAREGMVYAVERKAEAVQLLCQNRYALGAYNVHVVEGLAPAVLDELPTPDAVFIGGSGGEMAALLALVKARNPLVRVVINAIALETLQETLTALRALDFANVEVTQLAAARGREVGTYTMMTATNPIFILSGGGA